MTSATPSAQTGQHERRRRVSAFAISLGSFMEHCHNTQHEDHAMLLRWDIRNPGQTIAIPTPISTWEGTLLRAVVRLDQRQRPRHHSGRPSSGRSP